MEETLIARNFPFRGERILYCILNWGLGHATRSTPLIRFLKKNNDVWIGSDGIAAEYLQREFPEIPSVTMPAYNINYANSSMVANLLRKLPRIGFAILGEHKRVAQFVRKNQIDVVISDHRYGCYSKLAKRNIVISHHLNILLPNLKSSRILSFLNQCMLNKFDTCYIPDCKDHHYSGELSRPNFLKKTVFIGPISRFFRSATNPRYDAAIVLSGPEPSRSKFEELILQQASLTDYRFILVRGSTKPYPANFQNIEIKSLLNTNELQAVFNDSKIVVCRSGYSSIMDMIRLKKNVLMVPTPGQTEQEFLANRFKDKPGFLVQQQDQLNLRLALDQLLL